MKWWGPFEHVRMHTNLFIMLYKRITNCLAWMLQKSNQVIFIHLLLLCLLLFTTLNSKKTSWAHNQLNRKREREKNKNKTGNLWMKLNWVIILFYVFIYCFSLSLHFSLLSDSEESHVDFHHHVFTHYSLSMCLLLWMLLCFFSTAGHHSSDLATVLTIRKVFDCTCEVRFKHITFHTFTSLFFVYWKAIKVFILRHLMIF